MAQRGITRHDVRRVLAHPDRLEPDPGDDELLHAVKRFFRRGDSIVLRVVYNRLARPWRVVTVFFDRRTRRRQ